MNKKEIEKIAASGTLNEKRKLIGLLDSDSSEIIEAVQNAVVNLIGEKEEIVKKLMDTAVSPSLCIRLRSNSFDILKHLAMRDGNFLSDYALKNGEKYGRITAELMRYGRFTTPDFPKDALKSLAASNDEITKANALESIGILKIDLGAVLIKALNENFFVLSSALFSIGELKLKKAFPVLKEIFLKTEDRVTKYIIIESLSKIGGSRITDFLLELLKDNAKYKLDKIFMLKSLYRICLLYECDKNAKNIDKNRIHFKLSGMNLKISLFSLNDYEEKDAIDAILCYFSLLSHKKSRKLFKFILEFYRKNENIDEAEYFYIKEIIKKIGRPKFISEFIKSLKPAEEYDGKIGVLIDVLSDMSPRDAINLLDFYKDKKHFIELKLYLLKHSVKLSGGSYERVLIDKLVDNYIKDVNGDVRKSAVELIGRLKGAITVKEKIFNTLLKESYPDVIDACIETLSNLININGGKKYAYFFIDRLSLKNGKTVEYSLRILGNVKAGFTAEEISDLYAKFAGFNNSGRDMALKRILAKSLRNFDLINHKKETLFLLSENDEEVNLNYLESLLLSGEKNPAVFFGALNSGNRSEIFKYKIIELIQKTGSREAFEGLVSVLRKEKSKMVKIALLRALYELDKEKSHSILKKFNASKDSDLKNFSNELIKN
jgi:hypothetical protein